MHPAPDDDLLAEIQAAGSRLVEALTDQLAAGQTETLYSLQTAAAQVKRHTTEIASAGEGITEQLRDLTAKVTAEVTAGFQLLLRDATTRIGQQLAAEVDASTAGLAGAATQHATFVHDQLVATTEHLDAFYSEAANRADNAKQGLDWVAQQGAEQLSTAAAALKADLAAGAAALREHLEAGTAALQQQLDTSGSALHDHRDDAETRLRSAAESVVARLAEAGSAARSDLEASAAAAVEQLRTGAAQVLADVRAARTELDTALAEARESAKAELDALRKQAQVAERREESVAERLQGHVDALVARTDATVSQSLTHLRAVADALLERDAGLETRRADEFARVLESVLKDGGASTRKLRERIFRGMETAKTAAPVATPAPAPAPEPEPEPEPPVVQAPAKKAPAPKPVTRKAAPKAAPKPKPVAVEPVVVEAPAVEEPVVEAVVEPAVVEAEAVPEPDEAPVPAEALTATTDEPPVVETPKPAPRKRAPAKKKTTTPAQEDQA